MSESVCQKAHRSAITARWRVQVSSIYHLETHAVYIQQWTLNSQYSENCLLRPPKKWSYMTGGLLMEVQIYKNVGLCPY